MAPSASSYIRRSAQLLSVPTSSSFRSVGDAIRTHHSGDGEKLTKYVLSGLQRSLAFSCYKAHHRYCRGTLRFCSHLSAVACVCASTPACGGERTEKSPSLQNEVGRGECWTDKHSLRLCRLDHTRRGRPAAHCRNDHRCCRARIHWARVCAVDRAAAINGRGGRRLGGGADLGVPGFLWARL